MNTFVNALIDEKSNAEARTENGMKARETTARNTLDLFNRIGASRSRPEVLKVPFGLALQENLDLAVRTLLWARDVRDGAGERSVFRFLLGELDRHSPNLAEKLIPKIPELGRWDDLFHFSNLSTLDKALAFYADALRKGDGMAAKWAPREKTKNAKWARRLAEKLGLTPREYRKLVVSLSNTVEQKMSSKQFSEIKYSKVPSLAAARYQNAFIKNDGVRYSEYLAELSKPEDERDPNVKINAGAVYPYDVIKSLTFGDKTAADAQWKALPDLVGKHKVLPLVDVSGSMGTSVSKNLTAMDVAVSLGLYLSDRNTSSFKDVFLTFSETPELVMVKGTLSQKFEQMVKTKWGFSTNLHAAFDKILGHAVSSNVPSEDMPDMLLILSDMQFNRCVKFDDSAIEMIRRKYQKAGYKMPKVVFWNIMSRDKDVTVKFDDRGVALASGFSPNIMKSILADDLDEFTPWNVFMKTVNVERYDWR